MIPSALFLVVAFVSTVVASSQSSSDENFDTQESTLESQSRNQRRRLNSGLPFATNQASTVENISQIFTVQRNPHDQSFLSTRASEVTNYLDEFLNDENFPTSASFSHTLAPIRLTRQRNMLSAPLPEKDDDDFGLPSSSAPNYHRYNLRNNYPRSKSKASPPVVIVPFDIEEPELLPYIMECSTASPPQNELFYGSVIDPETRMKRYVPFPVRETSFRPASPMDIEVVNDEPSISPNPATVPVVNENGDEMQEDQVDEEEGEDDHFQSTESQPDPMGYLTPPYEAKELVCPGPPAQNSFSASDCYREENAFSLVRPYNNYEYQLCEVGCQNAEKNFQIRANSLHSLETSFSIADFGAFHEFTAENGFDFVKLNEDHFKAFEHDFELFYLLVKNCPAKYLASALALSLQRDCDFEKFLRLFFRLKRGLNFGLFDFYETLFMDALLTLPRISNRAYNFFTNSRNACFFLSEPEVHRHNYFYGKFRFNSVLQMLINYTKFRAAHERNFDFSGNPGRAWLLGIDIISYASPLINKIKFIEGSFESLARYSKAFPADIEIVRILYMIIENTKRRNLEPYPEDLLHYSNFARQILHWALSISDESMIEWLFETFPFEFSKEVYRKRIKIEESLIEVKGDDPLVYRVKIINKSGSKTVLLPKASIL